MAISDTTENKRTDTEQTMRRLRVCETCGMEFHTVRSARIHQGTESHDDGIRHVTVEGQE